jgi:hypothetical protein
MSGGLAGGQPDVKVFVLMNGEVVENKAQFDDVLIQMGIFETRAAK